MVLPGTPNLREAVLFARSVGVVITDVAGTGEWRFWHPSWQRSVKINCRRKDAPRKLLTMLRRTPRRVVPGAESKLALGAE